MFLVTRVPPVDDVPTISLSNGVHFNKPRVTTPPITNETGDTIIAGRDDEVGLVQGMIQSFYDAPGGFREELSEFTLGLGAEYWYNKTFTVRAGFFHEAQMKGNRRYLTFGAGLRYNVFALDISYLVPVNNSATSGTNPLENTLRFSLSFNLDKWGNDTKLERN